MNDPTAHERLSEARRDYNALLYSVALLTADRRLEGDVYRRVAGAGERHAVTRLVVQALRLLVDNMTNEARAEASDLLRARAGRLVDRFGDRLDTGADDQLEPGELEDTLRRLLGGDQGLR